MARTSLEHAFLPGASLWSDTRKFTPVHECAADPHDGPESSLHKIPKWQRKSARTMAPGTSLLRLRKQVLKKLGGAREYLGGTGAGPSLTLRMTPLRTQSAERRMDDLLDPLKPEALKRECEGHSKPHWFQRSRRPSGGGPHGFSMRLGVLRRIQPCGVPHVQQHLRAAAELLTDELARLPRAFAIKASHLLECVSLLDL